MFTWLFSILQIFTIVQEEETVQFQFNLGKLQADKLIKYEIALQLWILQITYKFYTFAYLPHVISLFTPPFVKKKDYFDQARKNE